MTTEYTARAVLWDDGGWELHVDGVGVTQVLSLDSAERQVRDMLETMFGSHSVGDAVVHVVLE